MKSCLRLWPRVSLFVRSRSKSSSTHSHHLKLTWNSPTKPLDGSISCGIRQYSTIQNQVESTKVEEPTTEVVHPHRQLTPRELREILQEPLKHEDFFNLKDIVNVEDLFNARVHYGHKMGSRHENMKEYLFGCRMDIDVIDLNKTLEHMQKALNFLAHMSFRKAVILFITRSPIHGHAVELMAKECGEYAQTRFWHNGIFTNAPAVFYTFSSEVRLPDVCVFFSLVDRVHSQHEAVTEAAKMSMATIGIVDSNVNPSLITYPIPGNDDSIASVELYCRLFKTAVLRGKEKRLEMESQVIGANA